MKSRILILLLILFSIIVAMSCNNGDRIYESFFEDENTNGNNDPVEITYIATFHLNGGTGFTDGVKITQKPGEAWALPPTIPSWIDATKKFIGWNTDGTVETFLNTSSWDFTEDKDIYAIYSASPVLDWYFAGGVPAVGYTPSGAYAPGTAITAPATVTKTGYTFTGWNPAFTGTMPDADITYSAQLDPITYKVHFDGNGATSGTMTDEVFTYDSPFHLNTNNYSKTNYAYKGWNTVFDGSGTDYTDEQIVNNLASTNGAVVTLYAKWNPLYTVTYDANGADVGSVPASPSIQESETTIVVLGNTGGLYKADYSFGGWNTKSDGTGTTYIDGSSFTLEADTTLYALWLPIYTVTYNGNGSTSGSVPPSNNNVSGTVVTVNGNTGSLAKTGYTFAGWNTAADGTGTQYGAGAQFVITGNMTLYARWVLPGYLPGAFSVSSGKYVFFSKGNLQATVNASGEPTAWKFATNQYDVLKSGGANSTIGTVAGDVDLLGWSTDGTGATAGYKAWGLNSSETHEDYSGAFVDWGDAYKAANSDSTNWRTLTRDELVYLLDRESGQKTGYATVAGVNGFILLPDSFVDPMKNNGSGAFVPRTTTGWTANVYTAENWGIMEANGAVFLPAGKGRWGSSVGGVLNYWTSTTYDSYDIRYLFGTESSMSAANSHNYRHCGFSVRLVVNAGW